MARSHRPGAKKGSKKNGETAPRVTPGCILTCREFRRNPEYVYKAFGESRPRLHTLGKEYLSDPHHFENSPLYTFPGILSTKLQVVVECHFPGISGNFLSFFSLLFFFFFFLSIPLPTFYFMQLAIFSRRCK